jgi:hypothetical protein
VPLGDDLGGAVDHADGGLIVDRIRQRRNPCGPPLGVGEGSVKVVRVLEVRNHREVDESGSLSRDQDSVEVTLGCGEDDVLRLQRCVVPAGRFAVSLDKMEAAAMLPALTPT